MKRIIGNTRVSFLAVLIMLFALQTNYAQTREKRDVRDFHELSVSSTFQVEIKVGNTESLEIEVDDRYLDDVITEVRAGKLVSRPLC